MSKLRFVVAAFAALLPFNWMRVWAYRLFLGYKIERARIGFGTIIAVASARIGHCKIGMFNLFGGPMTINIAEAACIGDFNRFISGFWTVPYGARYARCLEIEEQVLITSSHYFDVCGLIRIGSGSAIAGTESQFWTHGAGVKNRYVIIGKGCYVGSATRFAPGALLGDRVSVALGSVVTKKFKGDHLLIGGVPAEVILRNYDWQMSRGETSSNW